ncbi:MAG: hypothetical protein FWG25_06620, partial [Promicromonosporaceae bacterium]|nr:hypothetical protein [Promicromonosporaceae bacterium]
MAMRYNGTTFTDDELVPILILVPQPQAELPRSDSDRLREALGNAGVNIERYCELEAIAIIEQLRSTGLRLLDSMVAPPSELIADIVENFLETHSRVLLLDLQAHFQETTTQPVFGYSEDSDCNLGISRAHTSRATVAAFDGLAINISTSQSLPEVLLDLSRYYRDPRLQAVIVDIRKIVSLNDDQQLRTGIQSEAWVTALAIENWIFQLRSETASSMAFPHPEGFWAPVGGEGVSGGAGWEM